MKKKISKEKSNEFKAYLRGLKDAGANAALIESVQTTFESQFDVSDIDDSTLDDSSGYDGSMEALKMAIAHLKDAGISTEEIKAMVEDELGSTVASTLVDSVKPKDEVDVKVTEDDDKPAIDEANPESKPEDKDMSEDKAEDNGLLKAVEKLFDEISNLKSQIEEHLGVTHDEPTDEIKDVEATADADAEGDLTSKDLEKPPLVENPNDKPELDGAATNAEFSDDDVKRAASEHGVSPEDVRQQLAELTKTK